MSFLKELLELAEAKGIDTKQVVKIVEQGVAVSGCHPEYIAQALLLALKADWEHRS